MFGSFVDSPDKRLLAQAELFKSVSAAFKLKTKA
jgi:hypothetical protein